MLREGVRFPENKCTRGMLRSSDRQNRQHNLTKASDSLAFPFLLGATGESGDCEVNECGVDSAPSPPTPATSPAAGAEGEGESTAAVHTSLDRLGLGVVWVLGVDYGGGALIREWRR